MDAKFHLVPVLAEDDEDDPNWRPDDDFECDKSKQTLGAAREEAEGVACRAEMSDGVRVKQETNEGEVVIEQRPSTKRSEITKKSGRRGRPRLSRMTPVELEKWRSSKVSTELSADTYSATSTRTTSVPEFHSVERLIRLDCESFK